MNIKKFSNSKLSKKINPERLLSDISNMIDDTRLNLTISVNSGLTLLYWKIGKRINDEILKDKRADYGKQILNLVSEELTINYGSGFKYPALTRMVKFSNIYPNIRYLTSLSKQLSWSHFRELLTIENELQRGFYTEICRIEGWSVRTLRSKIDSMLYERTAISQKPDKLIRQELALLRKEDKLTPDLTFRDSYPLFFPELKDTYKEKDLEEEILNNMESFLLQLGSGFAFLERQKRITIDDTDYYIDLLFYHRYLRRLVVIELKLGDFKPEHKGQMELYLQYLDKYERQPNEEHPIGLILCAGKKKETIELLNLEKSGIKVATFWNKIIPKANLENKFREVVKKAESNLEDTSE